MWPREGIIISTLRELVIRLKNGARIKLPLQKNIKLGDTVYVLWNFHKNVPAQLWTEDEYNAPDPEESGDPVNFELPPDWDDPHMWAIEPEV
jgi:hypothetical protein